MTISLDSIPRFAAAQALRIAHEHYGIEGRATALPSERDQNFLIVDARGARFVLKIANRDDAPELLDFQHQAMRRVAAARCGCRVQEVVRSLDGADLSEIRGRAADVSHCVRVTTWLEGAVLADCTPRSPALFDSIGAGMARIDAALRGFTHPSMHRVLQWDLRHAGLAREHAHLLPRARRARVESIFTRWETIEWARLRHGVIHNDANDNNVLVEGGRMTGLLDFGDAVHTATVCDLAIALAYAMLHEREPLASAVRVIRAYHRHNPLTEHEQRVLYPLILARLSASVCYAAHNRVRNPEDAYQVVTEALAWELLDLLEPYSPAAAFEVIRDACA
ncbi:MAG: phosphotransferase [Steroidobacteraceae bacterium]